MIIVKIIVAMLFWGLCHFVCKKLEDVFPTDYTEYDRISSYMSVWMFTFFIVLIILSLF